MPLEALFRTPELDKAGRARQVERVKAQVFAALKDRGLIVDAASAGTANEQVRSSQRTTRTVQGRAV